MTLKKQPRELHWKYPATIQNVEQICSAVAQELDKYILGHKDNFAIQLMLREALNNAFMHGCNQNPLLSFSCSMLISDNEVIVEVSDEGIGFDWSRKPETSPETSNETGRGLMIYSIYADSIQYNEIGNCVTLSRILNLERNMTEIKVKQTGAQATIILEEKLVASEVPKLKSEMKRLMEEGVITIVLDCRHLALLDSTGIGCLVAAHNSLSKVNGNLSITQVSSDIYDLLSSMRLDRRIKIIPQVETQE